MGLFLQERINRGSCRMLLCICAPPPPPIKELGQRVACRNLLLLASALVRKAFCSNGVPTGPEIHGPRVEDSFPLKYRPLTIVINFELVHIDIAKEASYSILPPSSSYRILIPNFLICSSPYLIGPPCGECANSKYVPTQNVCGRTHREGWHVTVIVCRPKQVLRLYLVNLNVVSRAL